MAIQATKKKIMQGLPARQARAKLLEIFAEAEPGVDFQKKYPGIFTWMECWFRLRSRSETFEVIAQAFAEKVVKLRHEKHGLEQTIHLQRLELGKRLKEIEHLKAQWTCINDGSGQYDFPRTLSIKVTGDRKNE